MSAAPVGQYAEKGIDDPVGEAQHEQHAAEEREIDTEIVAIELGQMHVQRQRGHGERRAEQTVGQQSRRRQRCVEASPCRHVPCGTCALRASICVLGAAGGLRGFPREAACAARARRCAGRSQIAKNARANSLSSMDPSASPFW